ncbi:MAG: lipopolysaccharide biosynthesis protein [Paludibacter sp.]
MSEELREQTITGMIWSFIERFGSMLLQFIANIILARLLTPNDFGLIGMIMVFIAISNTLVDSGFSAALIQKKEVTQKDYSTIFFLNIILSVFLFGLLFVTAPMIADFYHQHQLIYMLRILGVILILNAFNIIQNTQLIRKVDFKKIAKINVVATFLACLLAIVLALKGFGVWSLVVQMIAIAFLKSLFLWIWNTWRPSFIISFNSLKTLFGFGSRLLFSALLDTLYNNLQSLIIGKVFSVRDLGFYSQAMKLSDVPVSSLSGVVTQVTFPVFAKLQNDLVKMKSAVQKSLKSLVYVNFPLMVLLIIIARPLFIILFTEKWNDAIPYFQILCLSGMLLTMHVTNLNILKATGRSDIFFKLEIVKKVIGISALFIGIQFGIMGMLYAMVVTSYFCLGLNAFFSGRVIKYGIMEQFKDVIFTFILSIVVGLISYFMISYFEFSYLISMLLMITVYVILYLGISKIMKIEALEMYLSILNERFLIKKNE